MITFTNLGHMGRIGNQLWELATSISLALRNQDTYIFPPWQHEQDFNLHNCFSNSIVPTHIYREPHFHYKPINYTDTKNIVLDLVGYYQSPTYFKDYQDQIKHLFTPINKVPTQSNTTAIHIRRTDYLKFAKEHGPLDINYYYRAMEIIDSKYYMIFSDDIEWCKQNFRGDRFIFSEGRTPIEDLSYMIACEHFIIANSSFSWWGAYLNSNPNKIVVCPAKWFGPALAMHNTEDLYLPGWIKI